MNYKVLYRKYRPDSFTNLVGQKHIVDILKNSIKEEKISHAYIFSGPRGTGKTSTARILAKSVNCTEPIDGVACGKCPNCVGFNTSPDIIEIDAASNNGVDEIRELINNVKIMPTSSKYKVYIIDEVHMLSQSAFNALLLTLEEPPEHVIFILATTNLESVPITILSRCQKYDFKRISLTDIQNRLEYICQEENIAYDEEALKEIALISDGGLRDALSILDQLSKNTDKITLEMLSSEIGTISNKKIENLISFIDTSNVDEIVNMINDLRSINLNYKVFIKKLIESLGKQAIKYLKGDITSRLTYDEYKKLVFELNEVINKINVSVDAYSLIEMILLSYTKSGTKEPISKKEEKEPISQPEPEEINPIPPEKPPTKKPKTEKTSQNNNQISIRINNCFVSATKEYLNKIKEIWQNFEQNSTGQLRGLISDTLPVTASDEYIIAVTTIKHKDKELNENIKLIEEGFNSFQNTAYKIVFIDEDMWQKEKTAYINNLQKGYKYEKIEENPTNFDTPPKETNIEQLAGDIFNLDKIEIE